MTLECGRVYVIPSSVTKPPKDKICLCVCDTRAWFFFVNTKASRIAGGSVLVTALECSALNYDSHLDLSGVVAFQPRELAQGQARDMLADGAIRRVIAALQSGVRTLPKAHADRAIGTLTAALKTP